MKLTINEAKTIVSEIVSKILHENNKNNIKSRVLKECKMKLKEDIDDDMMDESGKCKGSCIKKVGDKWRVVSAKTGKLWPAHYDTKEDAEKGLSAYFVNKNK